MADIPVSFNELNTLKGIDITRTIQDQLDNIVVGDIILPDGNILVGNASNDATAVSMSGDATIANTGVLTIANSAITNAKVSASAAIDFSKLASLSSANILVGNGSNVAAAVAVTGDISLSNAGVTAIASGVIVNADINASAAIDFSKLASLSSANILVGNGSNVAAPVAVTGDVSISNAGVTAIGSGVIVNADVNASAAIDFSKLAALTSGNILVGNGSNVATSVAMSSQATISNAGAVTLDNNSVIAKTLAGYSSAAGTISSSDSIVGAIGKLNGNRELVAQYASGSLTQAEILGLFSTPIELIPTPGSGKIIIIDEVVMFHDFDTAVYAFGGDVNILYAGSGDIVLYDSTLITGAADAQTFCKPNLYVLNNSSGTATGFDIATNENRAIQIANKTQNFTLGSTNNILKWMIQYHVVTLLT